VKILIITYHYTPDLTPRAFRWSAIAAEMANQGHQVDVLCAARVAPQQETNDLGVTVHRTHDALLNASARMHRKPKAESRGGETIQTLLRGVLRKIARTLWRMTYWPDYACGWVIPASRLAVRLASSNDYDWIISVSHPFTGHLVGYLARRHCPDARWLVDIGDPFSMMREPATNNHFLYRSLNRWIERRVIHGADEICVTTEQTRQLYLHHFSVSVNKITVVPPLLSLPDTSISTARSAGEALKMVFVGTLYLHLRNPQFLLNLHAALSEKINTAKIELHFYGALNDCTHLLEPYLDSTRTGVFVHGLVSRAEVTSAMEYADVLVNIGNRSESQLASKVIEYMAMGRPILNIVNIDGDISSAVLFDYPSVLQVRNIDDTVSNVVLIEARDFLLAPPPVTQNYIEFIKDRYSSRSVLQQYFSVMENSSSIEESVKFK
jgi:glycosyltransferase involved in cell wall biosynthesis